MTFWATASRNLGLSVSGSALHLHFFSWTGKATLPTYLLLLCTSKKCGIVSISAFNAVPVMQHSAIYATLKHYTQQQLVTSLWNPPVGCCIIWNRISLIWICKDLSKGGVGGLGGVWVRWVRWVVYVGVQCCVFWWAFECCTYPKAGQNSKAGTRPEPLMEQEW